MENPKAQRRLGPRESVHGIAGAVGGTGIIALSRSLGEPWCSVLAFSAPTLSMGWALLQGQIFGAFEQWSRRRRAFGSVARLKEAVSRLERHSETMALSDPSRRLLEERIDQINRAILQHEYSVIEHLVDGGVIEPKPHLQSRTGKPKAVPSKLDQTVG